MTQSFYFTGKITPNVIFIIIWYISTVPSVKAKIADDVIGRINQRNIVFSWKDFLAQLSKQGMLKAYPIFLILSLFLSICSPDGTVVSIGADIGTDIKVELFDEVLVRGMFYHQFDGIFEETLHASVLDVLVDEAQAGDDKGPALAGCVFLDELYLHVSGPVGRLPVVTDVFMEPVGLSVVTLTEDRQLFLLHLVVQEIVLEVLRHLEIQVFEVDGASRDVEGAEVVVSLEVQPVELAHPLDVGGVHDVVVAGVELPGLLEGADAGKVGDALATDINLLDGEGLLGGDAAVVVGVEELHEGVLEPVALELQQPLGTGEALLRDGDLAPEVEVRMRDQDGVGAFLLGDVRPQGRQHVTFELEEGVLSEGEHERLRGLVVGLDGVLDGGRGAALAVKDDGANSTSR